jgi:hypothetical protein
MAVAAPHPIHNAISTRVSIFRPFSVTFAKAAEEYPLETEIPMA